MSDAFDKQWLSDLPSEWVQKRADFLCDTYRITVDPASYEGDLVVHYSIPQVQETGGPAIEPASDIGSTKLLVNEPMLLVSKLNPRKQTICIAEPHEEYVTLASSEFVAISSSKIDQRYAYFLWTSQKVTDRLSAIVQSATRSHQRVNPSDITKLPWKWPPLDVQQRIAQFLDEKTARIDALIEKKRALLDRLAEKRQALITRAVTQGLDPDAPRKPSGIDWLGDVPAHWEVQRLKFKTTKIGSGLTPRGGASAYVESGVMLLRSQNVHLDGLELSDVVYIDHETDAEMANSRVQEQDVLLNITGASIGRCCVFDLEDALANVNQHVCIVRLTDSTEPGFINLFIQSNLGQAQIDMAQTGASREGLSFSALPSLPISSETAILKETLCKEGETGRRG